MLDRCRSVAEGARAGEIFPLTETSLKLVLGRAAAQGTFGFVGFNSERDADDAMRAMNRYELFGENLRVELTRDSMRPVTSGGGSHAFNAGERCYNCGQYGHWYVESRNKEGGVARRRIHVADVFSFF